MVVDALLAESVQAVEAFRVLVTFQTNLACQKFVINFLRELVAHGGRRCGGGGGGRGGHCCGVYLVNVDGGSVVALSFLSSAIPFLSELLYNSRVVHTRIREGSNDR